jgi:hypothetical protein
MSNELRARAEARLIEAAAALGLADPRPPLRERLKRLREVHPAAFERAVAHYEQAVLPALADADPVGAWLEYGRFVGQLTGEGRMVAVNDTGRATTFSPPPTPSTLYLFIPEEASEEVIVAAAPDMPSSAQEATLALLVRRELSLP